MSLLILSNYLTLSRTFFTSKEFQVRGDIYIFLSNLMINYLDKAFFSHSDAFFHINAQNGQKKIIYQNGQILPTR